MKDMSAPKRPIDSARLIYWSIFVLLVLVFFLMFKLKAPTRTIPILTQSVPAYHVITPAELTRKRVTESEAQKQGVVLAETSLTNHYTLDRIEAGQPIFARQIGTAPDRELIANTLTVAVPVSKVITAARALQAGDVVAVATTPESDSSAAPVLLLSQILVLDVRNGPDDQFVKLAIPVAQWPEFVTKSHNSKLILTTYVK